MNKKIIVFVLLFVFLVGVGVPDQAKANTTETTADDVKYKDVEDFMLGLNYSDFVSVDDAVYFVFDYQGLYYILEVVSNSDDIYACVGNFEEDVSFVMTASNGIASAKYYTYYSPSNAVANNNFEKISYKTHQYSTSWNYNDVNVKFIYSYLGNGGQQPWFDLQYMVYSDVDIYANSSINQRFYTEVDTVLYESNLVGPYTFEQWCSDAGLNCVASSNETEDTFPFEFDQDNWYIVRKNRVSGSEYTWYLSEFKRYGSDTWHLYSKLRAMADNTLGIADLSVDYTMKSVPVSNYVYDSSGGGWLFVDRPGFILQPGENSIDDIGISFGSSMPIFFSNVDIYSDVEQSSVYYSASAEYVDSEVFYPDLSPTSTPTPTPISSSGSSDLGGNVVAGGGIDFIISIFALIWSKIASIPMYVDGFQITIQQLYVYGALVTIVGGAIWAFIRRK